MVRFKNRWLLFEVLYEHTLPSQSILPYQARQPPGLADVSASVMNSVIREAIRVNFGEWGMGCIVNSMSMKYFSSFTYMGILRISRDHYHIVWAALTFIKEIRGQPCIVRCIHLSGTIIKAQKFAITYDREQILRMRNQIAMAGSTEVFDVEKVLEESQAAIMAVEM